MSCVSDPVPHQREFHHPGLYRRAVVQSCFVSRSFSGGLQSCSCAGVRWCTQIGSCKFKQIC